MSIEATPTSEPPTTPVTPGRFAAASHATWPAAEVIEQHGWCLRFTAGAGSRAASAWARGHCPGDLEAAIQGVESAYRARDLTPRFQLWPEDETLDAALDARGYTAYDRSLLMARPASLPWPAKDERCVAVEVRTRLAGLETLWADGGVGPARQAVLARTGSRATIFLGRVDMAPAGAVAIVQDGEVAVTQALWVMPAHRGCGLARCLMAAAGRSAAARGANVIAHAVVATNDSAIRLYESLGFTAFGAYHYRRAE